MKARQGKFIFIAQFRHKATQSALLWYTNTIKRNYAFKTHFKTSKKTTRKQNIKTS